MFGEPKHHATYVVFNAGIVFESVKRQSTNYISNVKSTIDTPELNKFQVLPLFVHFEPPVRLAIGLNHAAVYAEFSLALAAD